MTREEKEIIVRDLSEKFANTTYFYLTDASEMTVASINRFRRMCFDRGMDFQVYKNTLIRKALDTLGTDTSDMDQILKGQTGILFSTESGSAPARLLKDFYKQMQYGKGAATKPVLKGAYLDSDIFIGADQLETLSKIKSKQELIGEIIGLLQSPAKNVMSALNAGNKLAGLIKALEERAN